MTKIEYDDCFVEQIESEFTIIGYRDSAAGSGGMRNYDYVVQLNGSIIKVSK